MRPSETIDGVLCVQVIQRIVTRASEMCTRGIVATASKNNSVLAASLPEPRRCVLEVVALQLFNRSCDSVADNDTTGTHFLLPNWAFDSFIAAPNSPSASKLASAEKWAAYPAAEPPIAAPMPLKKPCRRRARHHFVPRIFSTSRRPMIFGRVSTRRNPPPEQIGNHFLLRAHVIPHPFRLLLKPPGKVF